ncbi:hypothetical protein KUV28_17695 [Ferrimonas balearica]|nr:hypothetical protein [Ferrimonas balearica]
MTDDDAFPTVNDPAADRGLTGIRPEVLSEILPGVMNLGDMILWPDPERAGGYRFLSLRPTVTSNADGSRRVNMIEAGDAAFLQVSAEWTVPAGRLEALRADLGAGQEDRPVILSPAAVTQVTAVLERIDNGEILAEARPSDLPPFTALFNVQLSGEARALAQAALAGSEGNLRLRYRAVLEQSGRAEIRISGQLQGDATVEALRQAMQAGEVDVTVRADTAFDTAGAGMAPPDEALLSQAALMLLTSSRPDDMGAFTLELEREQLVPVPVEAAADLALGGSPGSLFDALLPSQFFHSTD